jgi:glycolate oxidase iron-sulfur subunit
MQTDLDLNAALDRSQRERADAVLRRCVHCGFCNATCPTYALTGNELDGPRGRIYLIKQALERNEATRLTQRHLDRCLSCMACETTCPSGVRYHDLLDIGREFVDAHVRRPWHEALLRAVLRTVASRPRVFAVLMRLGRLMRPLLPPRLRAQVPAAAPSSSRRHRRPRSKEARRRERVVDPGGAVTGDHVVTLAGCVQPTLSPATNIAAARVLEHQGLALRQIRGAGCCGALHFHFGDRRRAMDRVRRNVTELDGALIAGAAHVLTTASGCGAFIRDYGDLLADDPRYSAAARRVSDAHRDIAEVIDPALWRTPPGPDGDAAPAAAFHCPCTLQHAQGLATRVPQVLQAAGITLAAVAGPARCCGSAGAYAVLQPEMADALGKARAQALLDTGAPRLLTANVGCQHHLARHAGTPVQHWVELLAERLDRTSDPH